MSTDWEATLRAWAKPPSDCEEAERDGTETHIETAIGSSPKLADAPRKVYAKGFYANNTGLRVDYRVDVAVEFGGFYDTLAAANVSHLLRRVVPEGGAG